MMAKAKRAKLVRINVVYRVREKLWAILYAGRFAMAHVTRRAALRDARDMAKVLVQQGEAEGVALGATVRVQRKADRTWQSERTYPRRLDPKRSKG
jgi:transcription elongation GreA/GreB family factor